MRALLWVTLIVSAGAPSRLLAQASAAEQQVPARASVLPPRLAERTHEWRAAGDSAKPRPFYLPRPGEQAAYWVGFGTGVALSPLVWCHGEDCGVLRNATRSLLLGGVGAISGLLLKRAF